MNRLPPWCSHGGTQHGRSEALSRPASRLRRMLPTRLDVPAVALSIGPDALPLWLPSAVGGLQLDGLNHPEASSRLGTEGIDEVAGFRHPVHVPDRRPRSGHDDADLRGPLARVGVAHPLKSSDTALTALILGYLAPSAASGECVAELEPARRERSLSVD